MITITIPESTVWKDLDKNEHNIHQTERQFVSKFMTEAKASEDFMNTLGDQECTVTIKSSSYMIEPINEKISSPVLLISLSQSIADRIEDYAVPLEKQSVVFLADMDQTTTNVRNMIFRDFGGKIANKNFSHVDFRGSVFIYISFENCTFGGCKMQDTVFQHCYFTNCTMSACNCKESHWDHCSIESSNLYHTRFGMSVFNELIFEHSKLHEVSFSDSSGEHVSFVLSSLDSSYFVSANLPKSTFVNCHLNDVDFTNANLQSSKLLSTPHECDFKGTNLYGVDGVYQFFGQWLSSRHDRLTAKIIRASSGQLELRFHAGCKVDVTKERLTEFVEATHKDSPNYHMYMLAIQSIDMAFTLDLEAGRWSHLP